MAKYVRKQDGAYRVRKTSKHMFSAFFVGSFKDYETAARMAQVFGPFIDEIPNHWILASSDRWPTLVRSQIHLLRIAYEGKNPDPSKIISNWPFESFPLAPLPKLDADEEEIEKYVNAMIMFASDELEILIKQERETQKQLTEKAND